MKIKILKLMWMYRPPHIIEMLLIVFLTVVITVTAIIQMILK